MKRREFLKNTALVGAGITLAGSRLFSQDYGKKPNVLLFIVDQMRQPNPIRGAGFPPEAKLPNLEILKSRGLEFTQHFVSAVPCSPSRACLFTGLFMDQNGVKTNIGGEEQKDLDPAIPTLGHIFRRAGYRTPYFGKWHLSRGKGLKKEGLDAYGFEYQTAENTGGSGLLIDEPWTELAINWLKDPKNQSQPWFLVLSLINPHDICDYNPLINLDIFIPDVIKELPPSWDDDLLYKPRCQMEYQDKTEPEIMRTGGEKQWLNYLNYYYYLNLKIDALLGKVMQTLEQTGQLESTLIIFTSDHGEMAGSHRLKLKGPFVYDENTNVPLVLSYPGRIPSGAKTNALCQNVDIFPTLAAFLGFDLKSEFSYLAGKNLAPVIADPQNGGVNFHLLFAFTENVAAERKKKARGQSWIEAPHQIRSIRERNWIYARYFEPGLEEEYEMYDLANDPLMMNNIAYDPAYKHIREELSEKLRIAEATEMSRVDFSRVKI